MRLVRSVPTSVWTFLLGLLVGGAIGAAYTVGLIAGRATPAASKDGGELDSPDEVMAKIDRLCDSAPATGPDVNEAMSKLVSSGSGVHRIHANPDGRVKTCIVVGQVCLPMTVGEDVARYAAWLDARGQFFLTGTKPVCSLWNRSLREQSFS